MTINVLSELLKKLVNLNISSAGPSAGEGH
jgi:hypothetical protein